MSNPAEDQPMPDAAGQQLAAKKDAGQSSSSSSSSPDIQNMTSKQVQELLTKLQSAEQELTHYRSQHEAQMQPVVSGLHNYFKSREDLGDDQRALHSAFVDTASKAAGGAESMRLWHAVNTENTQLKQTTAELTKQVQELQEKLSGHASDTGNVQRLLASFQQQQRGGSHAPGNVPAATPSTLLSGHSSSAIPRPTTAPTDFAKMLAERTAYHTAKLESDGRKPQVKRRMTDQQDA